MTLAGLGWDAERARGYAPWADRPDHRPARVAIEFNQHYRLYGATGEQDAVVGGSLKHKAGSRAELPAVGDWVVVQQAAGSDRGRIVAVLPRRSQFSRKVVGHVTDEQVVAANLDLLFVVMALDQDFSLRRLERYLLLTREGGAQPVIVLTKPDLAPDLPGQVAHVGEVAAGAPVLVVNPRAGVGVDALGALLGAGRTGALLGSSGVGKTTIVNQLLGGAPRRTQEVRAADAKGRHTTTHRELVAMPGGGWLIDTPGMRELQLWDADAGVRDTFDDVEALAVGCHFTDCRHEDEPRCAVKRAVEQGSLAAARVDAFRAVRAELDGLAKQREARALKDAQRRSREPKRTPRANRG